MISQKTGVNGVNSIAEEGGLYPPSSPRRVRSKSSRIAIPDHVKSGLYNAYLWDVSDTSIAFEILNTKENKTTVDWLFKQAQPVVEYFCPKRGEMRWRFRLSFPKYGELTSIVKPSSIKRDPWIR